VNKIFMRQKNFVFGELKVNAKLERYLKTFPPVNLGGKGELGEDLGKIEIPGKGLFGFGTMDQDEKVIISRTLEKMAKLSEIKMERRIRFFENWRLLRLKRKQQTFEKSSNLLWALEKLARRRKNSFFELKANWLQQTDPSEDHGSCQSTPDELKNLRAQNAKLKEKIRTMDLEKKSELATMQSHFEKMHEPVLKLKQELLKKKLSERDLNVSTSLLKGTPDSSVANSRYGNEENQPLSSINGSMVTNYDDGTHAMKIREVIIKLNKCVNAINDEGPKAAAYFLGIFRNYTNSIKKTTPDWALVEKLES
jgi:hypothetical protein